jgi:hypothetical protein
MLRTLRRALQWSLVALVATPLVQPLAGQADDERGVRPMPQWELRQDLTFASEPGAHLGVGLNVRAGYYARLGAVLAAGAVRRADDVWIGAPRLDLTARFLLDPFGERTRAFYGGGGVSIVQRAGTEANAVLHLVVGLEGRQGRIITPAVELGVGGGVRLGVVLRRTRSGQAR